VAARHPHPHVSDVTTTTELDDDTGVIAYRAVVDGGDGHTVRATVRDADGAEVARGDGAQGTLRIDGVQPWRPGAGYLYTLEVAVQEGRVHARPPIQGRRTRAAPALAGRRVSPATRDRGPRRDARAAGLRLAHYVGYGAGDAASHLAFSMTGSG
jgi:hypothetical protein